MTSWGSYPWGSAPWAGYLPDPDENFDLFCFEDVSMFEIFTDGRVSAIGDGTQFVPNPSTLDMAVYSGGAYVADDARIVITDNIPEAFTVEWTVTFSELPTDFTDLVNKHVYLGASDAAGPLVGLFVSKIGFGYTGSVSFSGTGDIQLDTAFQVIPGSATYVSEGEKWVIRVAADINVGVAYFYVTRYADLATTGHQLRAILPVIPYTSASTPPTDRAMVSVHGTALQQVGVVLDRFCVGSALIIPNLAPVADPGADQAARTCSIIQLDGSASFDPEGAALTYAWRLIDVPLTSGFGVSADDGTTYALSIPTGYTDRLHSTELGVIDALDPFDSGDVLLLSGTAYTITTTGIDGNGFYLQIGSQVLPESLSGVSVKVLRQRGISGPTTVTPTFYPDVPGFYRFDLTVFDGDLYSAPSSIIVNVLESPLPRGCTPDLKFIFEYLSDFWQLVEGKERIEVFWGSLAQVAATELLTLWQVEYSKSLRDIQRTFIRRWLHYDLLLGEPLPELTKHRVLFGGVTSSFFAAGAGGWNLQTLELESDLFSAAQAITIKLADSASAELFAERLEYRLQEEVDERFTTHVIEDRVTSEKAVRIDAPFPFTIGSNTTMSIFSAGAEARPPSGTTGGASGTRTYKVGRSLEGLGIKEDDFLVLEGVAYRVANVVDVAGDQYPYQRVIVKEDLPLASSTTWALSGWVQSELINFYGGLVDRGDYVDFEVSEASDEFAPTASTYNQVETRALGVNEAQPSRLAVDQWPIGAAIANESYNVYLARVLRKHYVPVDELVKDIPLLQEFIVHDDNEAALRRNLDFFLEEVRGHNAIHFSAGFGSELGDVWEGERPPHRLWAEYTYLDNNQTIEDNFGIAVDFNADQLDDLPSSVDYLSAVRGLFYAFYNGPTLRNLRIGSQILLGLPFVEEAGTIEEIRTDFSSSTGRMLIRDAANEQIVRSYTFPRELEIETNPATGEPYTEGDTVEQFAPLVEGVEVIDWVSNPGWYEGMLNQGVFFEVEKYHQFVVRVDDAAFSLSALLFARNFILKIKPTYTFPRFIVRKELGAEVSTTDEIAYSGKLYLADSVCAPLLGVSWFYDQPRPAGGGWRNQYDTDADPSTTPTYPTPQTVSWGFDKTYLCPSDEILVLNCETFAAAFTPPFDSAFAYDTPVTGYMNFEAVSPASIPALPGLSLSVVDDNTADVTGNLTQLRLITFGDPGSDPTDYGVQVYVNGGVQATELFTAGTNTEIVRSLSIPVVPGDVVTVYIYPATGGSARSPAWSKVSAVVKQEDGSLWTYDDTLDAGTYCLERSP